MDISRPKGWENDIHEIEMAGSSVDKEVGKLEVMKRNWIH